jgi:hypothetical protein
MASVAEGTFLESRRSNTKNDVNILILSTIFDGVSGGSQKRTFRNSIS